MGVSAAKCDDGPLRRDLEGCKSDAAKQRVFWEEKAKADLEACKRDAATRLANQQADALAQAQSTAAILFEKEKVSWEDKVKADLDRCQRDATNVLLNQRADQLRGEEFIVSETVLFGVLMLQMNHLMEGFVPFSWSPTSSTYWCAMGDSYKIYPRTFATRQDAIADQTAGIIGLQVEGPINRGHEGFRLRICGLLTQSQPHTLMPSDFYLGVDSTGEASAVHKNKIADPSLVRWMMVFH